MDCDLVVLGAGGTGLIAAVKAAEISGRKVIVLEKAKKCGGATTFASLAMISDSKWQKEAGIEVSDPPDITGQFFDWLVEKGGTEKYFKLTQMLGRSMVGIERMDKYKNHPDETIGPGRMGTYFVEKMLECCKEMNIPVLTETRARKFLTDDDGKISGVQADTPDGQLLVNCRACFIGAGGFGADYEKCRKVFPDEYNNKTMMCLCPPTLTGDCIDMAEEIGAKIDLSAAFFTGGSGPKHHPYSCSIDNMIQSGEVVYVNLNGERWVNEDFPWHYGRHNEESLATQPRGEVFCIADDDLVETLGQRTAGKSDSQEWKKIYSQYREHIAYEVALDEGGAKGHHTKKADTFVELALKMGIDPKAFVATMERYNRFCEGGKDLDFGKDPKYLVPVRKPPFYAFFGFRFRQCTKGGILVNEDTEVLDTDGNIMPGLFAGGDGVTIHGVERTASGGGLTNVVKTGYRGGITVGNYLKKL